MTYVLSDDKTFRSVALREAGALPALLHALALHECASVDGDGVLTPMMVKDAAGLFDLSLKRHVPPLVAHGIWHDAETLDACGLCLDRTTSIEPGQYLIHEWWKPLLHKEGKEDPVKRERELRRKRLWRNKGLVLAIRTRDRDLCRYCGIPTQDPSGPDKKDGANLTLDHVNPWGDNTIGNVVVACRRCNGIKRDRTPDEAGMVQLKPGTRAGSSDTDPTPNQPPDPTPSRSARETGPTGHGSGRGGAGTGPQSDTDRELEGATP